MTQDESLQTRAAAAPSGGVARLPDADAGPRDLDQVAAFIAEYWLVLVGAAFGCAIVALGAALLLPRSWRAEVLVAPVSMEPESPLSSLVSQYGGLANLAGLDLGQKDNSIASTVAMLRSRSFIEQFIKDEKLLPILYADRWDASAARWIDPSPDEVPTLQDGYKQFSKKVFRVVEDKEDELFTIRVDWTDRVLAARWANMLVDRINNVARQRAIRNADRSVEYLEEEIKHAQTVQLQQSIYSLLQTQLNKRMLANTRPDFAFSVIDPALVSDRDKYVWPNKLLFLGIGFFAGTLLAMVACLFYSQWVRLRGARGH